jgi:hypothetical protein
MAGDRLGYWFQNYITANGNVSTGDWETSCPEQFADGLADYGEMLDLFARVARSQVAINNVSWIDDNILFGVRLVSGEEEEKGGGGVCARVVD